MSLVRNIGIGFTVATGPIRTGMGQARGLLKGFQDHALSLKGALAGVGAAIGAGMAVAKFKDMAEAAAENVAATSRLADRVGTTTEKMSGLQFAAKQALNIDDVEGFGDALSDMMEKIGDVGLEDGGAKPILDLLGLDAKTLAKQDAVDTFEQIADKIKGLESTADKLHVADTLFGGEGQKMLPLLDQGAEGIQKMRERAAELGLTFNDFQGDQVKKAQQAVGELTARFEGLATQVVVQVAPYITAIIDKIQSFGDLGVKVTEVVGVGVEYMAKGIGIVADVIDVVHDAFGFLQAGAAEWFALGLKGWSYIGTAIENVLNLIPGVHVEFADTMHSMADEMKKLADESWDAAMKDFTAAPPSEGIDKFFKDIKRSSEEAAKAVAKVPDQMNKADAASLRLGVGIKELTAKLKEQIATFGMSSAEAEIYKLQAQGASSADLAEARGLAAKIKSLEDEKKKREELEGDAKSLFEETRKPVEKFDKKVADMKEMLSKGLINQDTFDRGVKAARKDLEGDPKTAFGNALTVGSDEARAVLLNNLSGGGDQPMDKVAKATAETAKQSAKQSTYLQQLVTFFTGGGQTPAFDF